MIEMAIAAPDPTRHQYWLGRLFTHKSFAVRGVFTGSLLLTALTSLLYTPLDPLAINIADRLQSPSAMHWFGTDQFGRDVLSRIMLGSTVSMTVGIITVGIGVVVGVFLGTLSGFCGGRLDEVSMRCVRSRHTYGQPRDSARGGRLGLDARPRHSPAQGHSSCRVNLPASPCTIT
jgi:peptide/nickel transport system permease protein